MRVLVLGCGEMAQVAIADLVRQEVFREVMVATRRVDAAEQFLSSLPTRTIRLSTHPVDVQDRAALVRLMKGCDSVCNLAGPNYRNAIPVAKAAIAAGVSLVDAMDDWETYLEMLELDEPARNAGITVVTGLGASPGVTNVLARYGVERLDRVSEIRTAWVMRGSDLGGPALSRHLLYSLPSRAFVFEAGRMREVRPFCDGRETVRFPELGDVEVYHIGHPEPFMLAQCFPSIRYADDKAAFLPTEIADQIFTVGPGARAGGPDALDAAADALYRAAKDMVDVPKTGALRTEVRGERDGKRVRLVYSAAGRIGLGTGVPAAIGAQLLAIGKIAKRGVHPPERCLDPEWFLQAVDVRNIGKVIEEVVEE